MEPSGLEPLTLKMIYKLSFNLSKLFATVLSKMIAVIIAEIPYGLIGFFSDNSVNSEEAPYILQVQLRTIYLK
tara:strand:+ start:258 stop:476 length:219 start_codon:yes stop_codon:yes gene_type:complete